MRWSGLKGGLQTQDEGVPVEGEGSVVVQSKEGDGAVCGKRHTGGHQCVTRSLQRRDEVSPRLSHADLGLRSRADFGKRRRSVVFLVGE